MTASDTYPPTGAPNRLAREKSPYLLQHAHNPVDWYPWGEEAFAKARSEGKPIFLSVGYSTCHWCHVMAHESFENPRIARLLNRSFVSIKVDREERPDIDRLYMTYVQSVTHGGGGWPMSVWLTPELKPFYGGTYFPPEDGYGRPGFARVLTSLAEAWRTSRSQLEAASAEALRQLQAAASVAAAGPADPAVFAQAALAFEETYDPIQGGFGHAPKFPRPSALFFLLRHHVRTHEKRSLEMVLHTLRAMADGGLHDQLGGGFHRYSTDAAWLIPHFEKMLYDQALLACAYLEAFQITGDDFFASVVRDTLGYVRRDLTGPEGPFYSAEDADSPLLGQPGETAEGAFYTWSLDDVRAVLDKRDTAALSLAFGLERFDNLLDGRHVLAVSHDRAREVLAPLHGALLAARGKRPRPHCDDKAVTAWNGLMVSAFARAYQVLGNPADRETAERAARFARQRLYDKGTGRLFRRYRDGEAAVDGYAEDYAFLIQGLLDLYEANFDAELLPFAVALQAKQDALFWDHESGGYFSSAEGAADVLVRIKETHDGAEPSANSVAALNLLRLGAITGAAAFRGKAERLFALCGRRLRDSAEGLPQMLVSLDFFFGSTCQIVVAGDRDAPDTRALLKAAQRRFAPNRVVLLADGGAGQEFLAQGQPSIRDMRKVGGRAVAYVCQGFTCQSPVTDAGKLTELLQRPVR
jgi:hypothetical protein